MDQPAIVHQPLTAAPRPLTADVLWTAMKASALAAFIRAFLVQIFGSIILGILGGIFAENTPSAPPIFQGLQLEATPRAIGHNLSRSLGEHMFWVLFGILFAASLAVRLRHYLPSPHHRRFLAILLRLSRKGSTQWFSLFVMNAFTAWISAMMLGFAQRFSWVQIVWGVIMNALQPVFHFIASLVPGASAFGRWLDWYGDNQVKFAFWFFYLAAISDDLGLPNLKTLFRWGLRRLRHFFFDEPAIDPAKTPGSAPQ